MSQFSNDLEQCLLALNNGGIILYPTDTIWGIGCDATNEQAVAKIYALKKRTANKSMIVLLAEEKDLLTHVMQPNLQIFDYIKGVAKPTTVIYEGATGVANNLLNEDGTTYLASQSYLLRLTYPAIRLQLFLMTLMRK